MWSKGIEHIITKSLIFSQQKCCYKVSNTLASVFWNLLNVIKCSASLTLYLFSSTHLKSSIIQGYSCKILFEQHAYDNKFSVLSLLIFRDSKHDIFFHTISFLMTCLYNVISLLYFTSIKKIKFIGTSFFHGTDCQQHCFI